MVKPTNPPDPTTRRGRRSIALALTLAVVLVTGLTAILSVGGDAAEAASSRHRVERGVFRGSSTARHHRSWSWWDESWWDRFRWDESWWDRSRWDDDTDDDETDTDDDDTDDDDTTTTVPPDEDTTTTTDDPDEDTTTTTDDPIDETPDDDPIDNTPTDDQDASWTPVPGGVPFDYQIGEPYDLPAGVGVVSRDWFDAMAADGAYNICYVNAFQTQDDGGGDRPDEQSNWPQDLVLYALGDDPNWGGEYLIDIGSSAKRSSAAAWVTQMVQTCANKGFDAVEYDNLDSWTRFDGTPLADDVPFGRDDAIAYATLLTTIAHDRGLAVAQKNTADLSETEARDEIGFDFAVVEECGQWDECEVFTALYGDRVVAIEYTRQGFANACSSVGDQVSVVRRDLHVTAPGSSSYIYDEC